MSADAFEKPLEVTQADINASASAEQNALKDSQMKYLLDRVVSLRVEVDTLKRTLDRAKAELAKLKEAIPEEDAMEETPSLDDSPVD